VPLPKRPAQQITLVVNETIVRRFVVAVAGEYSTYLPRELLRRGQDTTLRFLFAYCAAPGELATREDRPLTVAFHRLKLNAASVEPFVRATAGTEPRRNPADCRALPESRAEL
jgi:hypothetical protein